METTKFDVTRDLAIDAIAAIATATVDSRGSDLMRSIKDIRKQMELHTITLLEFGTTLHALSHLVRPAVDAELSATHRECNEQELRKRMTILFSEAIAPILDVLPYDEVQMDMSGPRNPVNDGFSFQILFILTTVVCKNESNCPVSMSDVSRNWDMHMWSN